VRVRCVKAEVGGVVRRGCEWCEERGAGRGVERGAGVLGVRGGRRRRGEEGERGRDGAAVTDGQGGAVDVTKTSAPRRNVADALRTQQAGRTPPDPPRSEGTRATRTMLGMRLGNEVGRSAGAGNWGRAGSGRGREKKCEGISLLGGWPWKSGTGCCHAQGGEGWMPPHSVDWWM
jgi:hypothetical protein